MKPFLLLATRREDEAADGEYAGLLAAGDLAPERLHRVRLEAAPLPPIDLAHYSGIIVGGSPLNASDPPEAKTQVQRRVERARLPGVRLLRPGGNGCDHRVGRGLEGDRASPRHEGLRRPLGAET